MSMRLEWSPVVQSSSSTGSGTPSPLAIGFGRLTNRKLRRVRRSRRQIEKRLVVCDNSEAFCDYLFTQQHQNYLRTGNQTPISAIGYPRGGLPVTEMKLETARYGVETFSRGFMIARGLSLEVHHTPTTVDPKPTFHRTFDSQLLLCGTGNYIPSELAVSTVGSSKGLPIRPVTAADKSSDIAPWVTWGSTPTEVILQSDANIIIITDDFNVRVLNCVLDEVAVVPLGNTENWFRRSFGANVSHGSVGGRQRPTALLCGSSLSSTDIQPVKLASLHLPIYVGTSSGLVHVVDLVSKQVIGIIPPPIPSPVAYIGLSTTSLPSIYEGVIAESTTSTTSKRLVIYYKNGLSIIVELNGRLQAQVRGFDSYADDRSITNTRLLSPGDTESDRHEQLALNIKYTGGSDDKADDETDWMSPTQSTVSSKLSSTNTTTNTSMLQTTQPMGRRMLFGMAPPNQSTVTESQSDHVPSIAKIPSFIPFYDQKLRLASVNQPLIDISHNGSANGSVGTIINIFDWISIPEHVSSSDVDTQLASIAEQYSEELTTNPSSTVMIENCISRVNLAAWLPSDNHCKSAPASELALDDSMIPAEVPDVSPVSDRDHPQRRFSAPLSTTGNSLPPVNSKDDATLSSPDHQAHVRPTTTAGWPVTGALSGRRRSEIVSIDNVGPLQIIVIAVTDIRNRIVDIIFFSVNPYSAIPVVAAQSHSNLGLVIDPRGAAATVAQLNIASSGSVRCATKTSADGAKSYWADVYDPTNSGCSKSKMVLTNTLVVASCGLLRLLEVRCSWKRVLESPALMNVSDLIADVSFYEMGRVLFAKLSDFLSMEYESESDRLLMSLTNGDVVAINQFEDKVRTLVSRH